MKAKTPEIIDESDIFLTVKDDAPRSSFHCMDIAIGCSCNQCKTLVLHASGLACLALYP